MLLSVVGASRWVMVPRNCVRKLRRTRAAVTRRDDGGFTLVEMIVAVVIILLVMFPFATLFYNTLNASAANASRQNAALIASTVLSHLDETTYADVGFTGTAIASAISSDSAYAKAATTSSGTTYSWTPNEDGDTTSETLVQVTTQPGFTVGTSATSFAPIMTSVIQGSTIFSVYTHIVAVSANVLSCNGTTRVADAYDRAFVEVIWRNGSIGSQRLWQDKLIYPGGLNALSSSSSPPATPSISSVTPQSVSGEVVVSWKLPDGWTSSTVCFRVGWSDINENQYGSGFLTAASNGTSTCPSVVGTAPPTYLTINDSTASYCVTGLTSGGSSQVYDFYVTAYSASGVGASAESGDASANAPLGPTISGITPVSGTAGSSVTLTGTGFSTSSQPFEFCSVTVSCTNGFSSNCSSATTYCQTVNCTSATQCSVQVPTLSSAATSGVYFIIAETTGSPFITSAPQAVNEFVYTPHIATWTTGASGTTITVTGTNLFASNTGFDFGTVSATNVNCSAGGTSCTMTVPDDASGNPLPQGLPIQLIAVDQSVGSNSVSYTP